MDQKEAADYSLNEWVGFFTYLDNLRESGATNMFGAAPYLLNAHPGMDSKDARRILAGWMATFSDAPARERVATMLAEAMQAAGMEV